MAKQTGTKIDWPLVALIAVVLTAAIAALRVLGITAEKLAEVTPEQWLLTASIIGGAAGTLYASFRGHVLGRSSVPVRERETPSGEEGSVALGVLMWIVLAGGAVVLGSLLTGCGASALRVHAGVASTLGATLDVGCEQLAADRTAASDACAAEPTADADAACVAAVRARYAPAVRGCQLAADAHDAWCEGLVEAAAGDDFDLADGLPWVTRALALGVDVVALLAAVGIEVTLPPELAALAGGGS